MTEAVKVGFRAYGSIGDWRPRNVNDVEDGKVPLMMRGFDQAVPAQRRQDGVHCLWTSGF